MQGNILFLRFRIISLDVECPNALRKIITKNTIPTIKTRKFNYYKNLKQQSSLSTIRTHEQHTNYIGPTLFPHVHAPYRIALSMKTNP